MTWTDDPLKDFERHEEEKEKWLASRPICDCCGEPIQEDYYFDLGDNEHICEDCLNGNLKVWID